MPLEPLRLEPLTSAKDVDEYSFKLTKRRKAFAASDEKIKQPVLMTNNARPQGARKDTALSQPSPKASPAKSSEDEAEF